MSEKKNYIVANFVSSTKVSIDRSKGLLKIVAETEKGERTVWLSTLAAKSVDLIPSVDPVASISEAFYSHDSREDLIERCKIMESTNGFVLIPTHDAADIVSLAFDAPVWQALKNSLKR